MLKCQRSLVRTYLYAQKLSCVAKKKRVHFTKGNENKRLYPVLPFPEDTEKNPFNNLDVVNFTDLCTVSVSKPRENIQNIYVFLI